MFSVYIFHTRGDRSVDRDELMATGFAAGELDGGAFSAEQISTPFTITLSNDTTMRLEGHFSNAFSKGMELPEGVDFNVAGTLEIN